MRDRTTEPVKDEVAPTPKRDRAAGGAASPTIFDLAQRAGNQAVVALLAERQIQPKLQVGAVSDPAELEADRLADQVLDRIQRSPIEETESKEAESESDTATSGTTATSTSSTTAADGDSDAEEHEAEAEEKHAGDHDSDDSSDDEPAAEANAVLSAIGAPTVEDSAATVEDEKEESESETEEPHAPLARVVQRRSLLRRKADGAPGHGPQGGPVDDAVARDIDRARGGGAPLDPATRSRMEEGFGADFGAVRIHTGSEADALSRSLNARAFTTGQDIFFAGGGAPDEKILAHELAHTVQQGAAPALNRVNRFMGVPDFEALTYESWDSFKSTAQKEIIKMLKAYSALGSTKDSKKKGVSTDIVVPPEKLDTAIQLVTNMKAASRAYLDAKEKAKKKKDKRYAGFVSFAIDCDLQLAKLNQQKQDATGVQQAPVEVDSSGLVRLQEHYKGSISSAMEKAATVLNALAPSNGDSGEFTMELKIPVMPGMFIGAEFEFEVAKDGETGKTDGTTEIDFSAGFVVGGSVLFADIQASLGGYMSASAKTTESALKLLSYGLYRRCRESSVIPSEVGSYLWGGDAGAQGKKKAEEWSLGVESEEFGEDSESFVETGGYVAGKAGVEGAVVSGEVGAKLKSGKRYDKESLASSEKGGAGKKNTMGDNWFAQKSTGRSVQSVEVSGEFTVLETFGAGITVNWLFESPGGDQPSVYKGFELEVSAEVQVPAKGFEAELFKLINSFISTLKKAQSGQLDKASTASKVKEGAGLAKGVADATAEGIAGMPIKDVLLGKASESGGESIFGSTVGLELAYSLESSASRMPGSLIEFPCR